MCHSHTPLTVQSGHYVNRQGVSSSPHRSSSSPDQEPRIPPPERYGVEVGYSWAILTQCELLFGLQPSAFPTERSKVAYVLSLLTGRARHWGTAEWAHKAERCALFEQFSVDVTRVFDPANPESEATFSLLNLSNLVIDNIIEFRTAAADSSWNETALIDAFYQRSVR